MSLSTTPRSCYVLIGDDCLWSSTCSSFVGAVCCPAYGIRTLRSTDGTDDDDDDVRCTVEWCTQYWRHRQWRCPLHCRVVQLILMAQTMTVSAVLRNGVVVIDGTDSDDVRCTVEWCSWYWLHRRWQCLLYCGMVQSILMAQTMTVSAVLRNGAVIIDGTDSDDVRCTAEWCSWYWRHRQWRCPLYCRVVRSMPCAEPLTSVDLLSDGATLVVGSSRGRVLVFDLRKTSQPVHSLTSHQSAVTRLAFAANQPNAHKVYRMSPAYCLWFCICLLLAC